MLSVLIGPPAAGKSTIGRLVADMTGQPFIDADDEGGPLYAEVGWSVDRLFERSAAVGFTTAHREWEVALAHAVVRLVAQHPAGVLALGAGHSHISTPQLFDTVRDALASAAHVVHLTPSSDPEVCHAVLRARCLHERETDWVIDGVDWLHTWLYDGLDDSLATCHVATGTEPADVTARRVGAAATHRSGSDRDRRRITLSPIPDRGTYWSAGHRSAGER